MNTIYEPIGRAKEYAPLALNLYEGCPHGCLYCYNRLFCWHNADRFVRAAPRPGLLRELSKRVEVMRQKHDPREINLCFSCDPYPRGRDSGLTRQVLELLSGTGLHISVLTKAGTDARRDFDLLFKNALWFGQTVGLVEPADLCNWEPQAAGFSDRVKAFYLAHECGIKTWASVEPVIDHPQALEAMVECLPWVDRFKVGKFNHIATLRSRGVIPADYKEPDWARFLADTRIVLKGKDVYYNKEDRKSVV